MERQLQWIARVSKTRPAINRCPDYWDECHPDQSSTRFPMASYTSAKARRFFAHSRRDFVDSRKMRRFAFDQKGSCTEAYELIWYKLKRQSAHHTSALIRWIIRSMSAQAAPGELPRMSLNPNASVTRSGDRDTMSRRYLSNPLVLPNARTQVRRPSAHSPLIPLLDSFISAPCISDIMAASR